MCSLFQTGLHNEFIEKFSFVTNQYMQALGGIVPIFNYMVSLQHLISLPADDDKCRLLKSVDYLHKHFGIRSGQTECRA